MDGFCLISSTIFESTSRTHLALILINDCTKHITNQSNSMMYSQIEENLEKKDEYDKKIVFFLHV